MDLFSTAKGADRNAPLAVRMRPRTVEEVVGQNKLLVAGSPLTRLIQGGGEGLLAESSVILWGPPGTGKTTLAYLVASAKNRLFMEVSAVESGVKELRKVIAEAKYSMASQGLETVLFVDEVHRFSKTQQDALLPAVENNWVTLVAATTENPHFSIITPLLSRSLLITLKPLEPEDIGEVIDRALSDPRGLDGRYGIDPGAREALVRLAGADARKALTVLEAAAGAAGQSEEITPAHLGRAIDSASINFDRDGDEHYDVTSAFIKSMRGSDADAALHYLARMLEAGEDPRFIARRVMIAASEEVGMADPSALQTATAAAQAVALVGMPEARLILAQAVIHIATAPKSNASYNAINAAIEDVRRGRGGPVPNHLRDGHYAGAKELGHGIDYRYAHDYPQGIAAQQYLPQKMGNRVYYRPTQRGFERQITARLTEINKLLGRDE